MYINSYYTGEVRRELERRELKKELAEQANLERLKKASSAYNSMNHHSYSEEQKQMFETIWRMLNS